MLGVADEQEGEAPVRFAVRFAFGEAAAREVPLLVVRAWRCPLAEGGLSPADLLVVGAPRRAGHFGLQLGPVAHTLLHHALCPVAVVPQRA
ncbi:universal stress protein [Streptomyces jumonjinensis]|uniref:universal stress protein n=1 Tax=Streptomyces jumonjinensis TaxID=1945 RepID=UPI0037B7E2CE